MKETLTDTSNNATWRLAHARMYATQCLHDEAQAIEDLVSQLDENFDRGVELIYHCRGKVIVTGAGKSGNVGSKIANSGQTDELLRFIPIVLHNHIPIISMTGNPESLLAKYSTAHILVSVKKEACPLNLAPTSSTTAALAMGDALAIALMEVRNFKPADFAQFHPGGELGKRLLTTAQDVMKTDELPVIPADMHLGEAIIHVSKGKLGLGVSLSDNKVEGIITDGDIRRAMERWQEQFFGKTVRDIMTTNPKCVTPHTKITEIQRIMNKYKVHSVLVIDQQRHLLGVVDHYRCML